MKKLILISAALVLGACSEDSPQQKSNPCVEANNQVAKYDSLSCDSKLDQVNDWAEKKKKFPENLSPNSVEQCFDELFRLSPYAGLRCGDEEYISTEEWEGLKAKVDSLRNQYRNELRARQQAAEQSQERQRREAQEAQARCQTLEYTMKEIEGLEYSTNKDCTRVLLNTFKGYSASVESFLEEITLCSDLFPREQQLKPSAWMNLLVRRDYDDKKIQTLNMKYKPFGFQFEPNYNSTAGHSLLRLTEVQGLSYSPVAAVTILGVGRDAEGYVLAGRSLVARVVLSRYGYCMLTNKKGAAGMSKQEINERLPLILKIETK